VTVKLAHVKVPECVYVFPASLKIKEGNVLEAVVIVELLVLNVIEAEVLVTVVFDPNVQAPLHVHVEVLNANVIVPVLYIAPAELKEPQVTTDDPML